MAEPDTPSDEQTTPEPDAPQGGSAGSGGPAPESAIAEEPAEGRDGLASDLRPGPSALRPASYDPVSLRHIDWGAAFPFVNLFRGFRLAVHPSKLLLALAAVLLLYTGGRILDGIWLSDHQATPGEAETFDAHLQSGGDAGGEPFYEVRRRARAASEATFDSFREEVAREREAELSAIDLGDVRDWVRTRRDEEIAGARTGHDEEVKRITADGDLPAQRREELLDRAARERDMRIRSAYTRAAATWNQVDATRGRGLFAEFYDYESRQFDRGVDAVLSLDVPGVLGAIYRVLWVGPLWGFSQHPVYFTLFFLWFLVLAAVFGGAISRIAAVQVARDEKISLRSALRFSTGKFVSFLSAPLIPVLIIAAIALAVAVAGLLGNIPWLGELVVGALFIFALIAGFVITLVLLGLVGGFSLMYPTIAAEGTDSFDAISRSFSYLYARPWRLAFYALVGLLYGALTYLFVRLFIWLVLLSSHTAASLFIWRDVAGKDDVLEAMWPQPPSYGELTYDIPYINLSPVQDVAATLLAFWVYLFVALVVAYVVSLYFSLSTIIYFLMRREVDATELDDVYLDPHDEEFAGYNDVPDADTDAPIEPAPVAGQ